MCIKTSTSFAQLEWYMKDWEHATFKTSNEGKTVLGSVEWWEVIGGCYNVKTSSHKRKTSRRGFTGTRKFFSRYSYRIHHKLLIFWCCDLPLPFCVNNRLLHHLSRLKKSMGNMPNRRKNPSAFPAVNHLMFSLKRTRMNLLQKAKCWISECTWICHCTSKLHFGLQKDPVNYLFSFL